MLHRDQRTPFSDWWWTVDKLLLAAIAALMLAGVILSLAASPLRPLALQAVQLLRAALGTAVPIIAAGGIDSVRHAQDALAAGADLVQVYTGLIYRGPALVREIASGLESG